VSGCPSLTKTEMTSLGYSAHMTGAEECRFSGCGGVQSILHCA